MAESILNHIPRRLPVFFILDTSVALASTFQVTMQDGLLTVKRELIEHPVASRCVYLSAITFGENATMHPLAPLKNYVPPTWEAHGRARALERALELLSEVFTSDLIETRHDRLGDYTPLVFLILGGRPSSPWQEAQASLKAYTDNRQPLIVTLVTQIELVREMKALTQHILLLQPAEARYMTSFFFWVVRVIAKVCEDSERGATAIDFPVLPHGVVVPC